jgi:aerobic-type carbon monoxide dehydrogenase small subunit (CoxS/CutS family)
MKVSLVVNGERVDLEVDAGATLLEVLRDRLGLRGSKEACGRGECGACTVLHGDDAITSCVMLAGLVTQPVRTIEALAPECTELRQRLADAGGMQCGFCTPGQIVRALSLDWERIHDEQDLRHEMAGNICRCTGYVGLMDAIWASRPDAGRSPAEDSPRTATADRRSS